ncbi:MAG: hypothetical protein DCC49_04910 [Acidobacteria bacterium]|nr:MAG: hypothetical protein DCC49_04910 [Acidobacteriota bacterium]
MGFADEHLNPGEELILNFKPHWKALVPAALWTVLISICLGVALWILPDSWRGTLRSLLLAVAAIAWLILALPPVVRWLSTEIILTDERLVTRRGVIRRITYDIPVDQINSVTIHQGLFDRILRAGNLVVESASDTGDQVIEAVPRPTDVQNTISRAKSLRGR